MCWTRRLKPDIEKFKTTVIEKSKTGFIDKFKAGAKSMILY